MNIEKRYPLSKRSMFAAIIACIAVVGSPTIASSERPTQLEVPSSNHPSALTPKTSVLLKGDREEWRSRAVTWYHSDDLKSRRRQMREMSRPLKQPCYYCHKRSFKGYVEKRYMIGLQMMAVSAEQSVKCSDCHVGKRGLTRMGAISLIQWRYAAEKKMDCSDCHLPQQQFKSLNERGLRSKVELIEWAKKRASTLKVPL